MIGMGMMVVVAHVAGSNESLEETLPKIATTGQPAKERFGAPKFVVSED
jgi:hypothetical protein